MKFGRHCELCTKSSSLSSSTSTSRKKSSRKTDGLGSPATTVVGSVDGYDSSGGGMTSNESSPVGSTSKDRTMPAFLPHTRSDSDGSAATVTSSVMSGGHHWKTTPSMSASTTPTTGVGTRRLVKMTTPPVILEERRTQRQPPSKMMMKGRRTDSSLRSEAATVTGQAIRLASESTSDERARIVSLMMDHDSMRVKKSSKVSSVVPSEIHSSSSSRQHGRQPSDGERSGASRSREVRRKFGGYRRRG